MRLDQMLVERGLVASRARARDLIARGFVTVKGVVDDKPAREVDTNTPIDLVMDAPQFVSRGAEKLQAALDHFKFDPAGLTCLDVGASTGGFTECLLQRGARKVYSVDVGHSQLHASLRSDDRVVALDKQDARGLIRDLITEDVQAIVADVSFISLTKAIGPALALCDRLAWLIALIKPQFELEPDAIGKGGIVRDDAARERAQKNVETWIAAQPGWRVVGVIPSPILGGSGNEEFLIGARRNDG